MEEAVLAERELCHAAVEELEEAVRVRGREVEEGERVRRRLSERESALMKAGGEMERRVEESERGRKEAEECLRVATARAATAESSINRCETARLSLEREVSTAKDQCKSLSALLTAAREGASKVEARADRAETERDGEKASAKAAEVRAADSESRGRSEAEKRTKVRRWQEMERETSCERVLEGERRLWETMCLVVFCGCLLRFSCGLVNFFSCSLALLLSCSLALLLSYSSFSSSPLHFSSAFLPPASSTSSISFLFFLSPLHK